MVPRGRPPRAASSGIAEVLFEDEAIHRFEQVARELRHLIRRGSQLCGARRGLLNQLTHPLHRANHGLRARSLLFHGRVDFLRDFGETIPFAIWAEPLDCSIVAAPISCENL